MHKLSIVEFEWPHWSFKINLISIRTFKGPLSTKQQLENNFFWKHSILNVLMWVWLNNFSTFEQIKLKISCSVKTICIHTIQWLKWSKEQFWLVTLKLNPFFLHWLQYFKKSLRPESFGLTHNLLKSVLKN